MDKAKGKAKEAAGAMSGDEARKAEGRAEEGRRCRGGQTEGEDEAGRGQGRIGRHNGQPHRPVA